jgi:hypothetical protein
MINTEPNYHDTDLEDFSVAFPRVLWSRMSGWQEQISNWCVSVSVCMFMSVSVSVCLSVCLSVGFHEFDFSAPLYGGRW